MRAKMPTNHALRKNGLRAADTFVGHCVHTVASRESDSLQQRRRWQNDYVRAV
jgi:hypothetical protein